MTRYIFSLVPPSVCFADFRWDDCGKPPKAVIYYYKPGSRCEIGMWKGCLPNPNMFADEYECINTCIFVQRSAMQNGTEESENKATYQTEKPESDLEHKYQYKPEADTWLRLHIVPQTWKYAIRQCQLEGGVLASPSSEALTKAMLAMMIDFNVTLSRGVFIGLHALISEGDYMSLDGVQGEPSATDNPNDWDVNKKCVVLDGKEAYNVSCNSKHSYFCRKENNSMVFHEDCKTTSVGYTYSNRTHSCYKFHSKPETWYEAVRVCHAEGTHLVVINSDIEAELLIEILAKNPSHTVIGATYNDVAIVGIKKSDDGQWRTIYGQHINDTGYAKWAKNQPNDYNGDQTVGSFQRTGGFDDIADYNPEPFFCEISPENELKMTCQIILK